MVVVMNKQVQKIYNSAVKKSYFLRAKGVFWTGYFTGKVDMCVADADLNKFYQKP